MTCFDCRVCFGSKFTSSAEGRRFNWLIYDSMTSLFACGRFSKFRGLSASVSFLPSFPLFYSLHSSPCNSLLPNCTETLATQATLEHEEALKSYSIHITRHRAGTYSGDTKHLQNQNMCTQNKLRYKHVPGTSIHFTHT